MVIENTKKAMRIWIRNLISTIALVTLLIILYMLRIFENPILGIGQFEVTIVLAIIYLYLVLLPIVLGYQFVYLSDEDRVFHVKYFNMGFLPGRRKSFEFPLHEFQKYDVDTSFFKLRKSITIYRKVKKGIAKYPALSISAFNESQQKQILSFLDKLARS